MRNRIERAAAVALTMSTFALGACGGGSSSRQTSTSAGDVRASAPAASSTPTAYGDSAATASATPAKHHSKLAGAAVGAVAGHMLGGHAVLGAAAGAMVQHERNKHQP